MGKLLKPGNIIFLTPIRSVGSLFPDKVASTQCRPLQGRTYGYYSQSGQNKAGPPPSERSLVREGYFAMELAGVLEIGEVKSEAEAEDKLATVSIAPKKGWISDYPLTPNIVGELRNAVSEAADSGKIAMNREEAIKAFQDLITSMESQNAGMSCPLVGNPILSRIMTLGSIILPITTPIHTTSVVIIVPTTPIAVIGGSQFKNLENCKRVGAQACKYAFTIASQ